MIDPELEYALKYLRILAWIAVVLVALLAVAVFFGVYQSLQPKGRVSCADFGSYTDALNAYRNGAIWLDRNHNGIPCSSRFLPRTTHNVAYGEDE